MDCSLSGLLRTSVSVDGCVCCVLCMCVYAFIFASMCVPVGVHQYTDIKSL